MSTLRELKKHRTREAIVEAALGLFAEYGYDAVTMAAVARAAGVGERTVYRYFPDKEEVVFAYDDRMRSALGAAMDDQPADVGPVSTMRSASRGVAVVLEQHRVALRQRATLVAATPALRARERIKQDGWQQLLADALVERGVEPLRARLYGAIGVACFVEALERWLGHGTADLGVTALSDEIDGALADVLALD